MKKYRTILAKISVALVLVLGVIFSMPWSNSYAKQEPHTVKVGFFAFNGYHEIGEGGRLSGYGYDFLKLLQRYANLNYEYIGYYNSWEEMKQMLLKGEIDMVTSARKMPEREQLYAYSKPIGISYAQITARSTDYRYQVHNDDYSSLNGARIGVLKGSSRIPNLQELAQKYGFTYEMVEYANEGDLSRALKNGTVDLLATSSLRKFTREKIITRFAPEEFYAIVRKDDKELLSEINYGIEQMNLNEGDWSSRLYYKNYAQQASKELTFSQRELDYIEAVQSGSKKIIAAVPSDANPYAYIESGKVKGIIPEYFAYLMDMAGLPYETLPAYSREQYKDIMRKQQANVYMANRITSLHNSIRGIDTDSYMQLNIARVTRKNFTGQIHSIASLPGDERRLEENIATDVKWITQTTRDGLLNSVNLGLADACYVYSYIAYQYIREHPDSDLTYTTLNTPVHSLHITITDNTDHELVSILNKCIKADGGHKLDAIVRQQLVYDVPVITLRQFVQKNPWYVLIGLVILTVGGYITYLNARMRKSAQQLADERLAYAETLHTKNQELEASMKAEQRANMAKRQFLFNMSHDIRTPMNAILGFTQLAEKHLDDSARTADYLSKINRSGANLLALINNVLEMSRIETGKQKVHEEVCDVHELVDSILVSFDADVQAKNLQFTVEREFIHNKLWLDATMIRQIVVNLLSNAVKYTPAGGKILYSVKELPSEREGYCQIQCMVKDNGIGMSKEFLPHIFEQFEREQTTTAGKVEGSGLGMAIVKRMLDMLKAKINVESELGKGTTITVLFEQRYVENEKEAAQTASATVQTASFVGRRVLLAEDNNLNAEIAMAVLGEAGLAVERAADGKECVELIKKHEAGYYDVVLMDVQMPELNGYEATKLIRSLADEGKRSILIIAMTANAFAEDKEKALEAGMDDFLPKPVNVQKMLGLLAKRLGEQER